MEEDYPAEQESATIKVADLINMRAVLPKSKIRRDMFGNLRAVPRSTRMMPAEENEGFTLTQQQQTRGLDSLLHPTLYVEHLTRVARSCDRRGDKWKINQLRAKFSGRQKSLQGCWNPYLSMRDDRKYAQIANPYF